MDDRLDYPVAVYWWICVHAGERNDHGQPRLVSQPQVKVRDALLDERPVRGVGRAERQHQAALVLFPEIAVGVIALTVNVVLRQDRLPHQQRLAVRAPPGDRDVGARARGVGEHPLA